MRKRRDLEGPIHLAILSYLRLVLPPSAVIHHSPNELNIGGDRVSKAIAQNKAKLMGMVPGWADIEFVLEGRVYFLEVKPQRGRQSENQKAFELDIVKAGAPYEIVRSVEETKAVLKKWGLI